MFCKSSIDTSRACALNSPCSESRLILRSGFSMPTPNFPKSWPTKSDGFGVEVTYSADGGRTGSVSGFASSGSCGFSSGAGPLRRSPNNSRKWRIQSNPRPLPCPLWRKATGMIWASPPDHSPLSRPLPAGERGCAGLKLELALASPLPYIDFRSCVS